MKYTAIEVGIHIKLRKKCCTPLSKTLRWKTPLWENNCKDFMMIVGKKVEHFLYNPHLTVQDGGGRRDNVILMITIYHQILSVIKIYMGKG